MTFTELFRAALEAADLSHAEFAEQVGVTPAFISQVATRRSKPPLDTIRKWADALGIKGADRNEFLMQAGLTHVRDPAVRDLIASEIDVLRAEVVSLSAEVRRNRKRP